MLEFEHLFLDLLGERFVELVELAHDPLFGCLAGAVDNVCRLSCATDLQRALAMGLGDALVEQFFEHFKRRGRYRAQRGDAVNDGRLRVGRKRVQNFGSHFRIELDQ